MLEWKLERAMRIELTLPAWKAGVLPLNYARVILLNQLAPLFLKTFGRRGPVYHKNIQKKGEKASVLPLNYSRILILGISLSRLL